MRRRCFLSSLAAAATAQPQQLPFQPSEGPNAPLGSPFGLHPGRVVWTRDPSIATWDGATGHWWDDANTNQRALHALTSQTLQLLTGRQNDKKAWDALFRSFNERTRRGRHSYRPGETIAIKINCNQDRSPVWGQPAQNRRPLNGLPSPHAINALVTQLIESAGVRGDDILLYDVTGARNVGHPISALIRSNPARPYQNVRFLVGTNYDLPGRLVPTPDTQNPITFSNPALAPAHLPTHVTDATYMINMALLRPHGMAGVTLTAKNHFGSVHTQAEGWSPRALHNHVLRSQPMGAYNALADLIAHPHLGGKTMLYLLDAIYSAEHNEGNVFKWTSLNNHWPASLLASQDPIAIDSVALDILASEPRATHVRGNADNYLHQARAHGVHEHWNNPQARQYSRNLGLNQGIELIARA